MLAGHSKSFLNDRSPWDLILGAFLVHPSWALTRLPKNTCFLSNIVRQRYYCPLHLLIYVPSGSIHPSEPYFVVLPTIVILWTNMNLSEVACAVPRSANATCTSVLPARCLRYACAMPVRGRMRQTSFRRVF
jgi:hypothetical protein